MIIDWWKEVIVEGDGISIIARQLSVLRMALRKSTLLAFLSFFARISQGQNTTDNLKYVDQLIGSANGGRSILKTPSLYSINLGRQRVSWSDPPIRHGESRG